MPTFSKRHKILKRSDFLRCYDGGKRHFTSSFIIFVLPTNAESWRLGLAVSRKVGGAVQRNRIKRLLREFFRLHQDKLPPGLDLAVVPKRGVQPDKLTYSAVERELLSLVTGMSEKRASSKLAAKSGNTVFPGGAARGFTPRAGRSEGA